MNLILEKLLQFESLSLNELNSSSSFLKRIDRKFLLTKKQLSELIHEFENDFRILEIGEKRIFAYDNIYMDTHDYFFYNQHEEKHPSRTKVRTRLYEDSNIAFFEFKQKKEGVTNKFRYQFPTHEHGEMTKGKSRFYEGIWQSLYDAKDVPEIFPSIKTKYKRITLVNKTGSERLTIDFDIETQNLRDKKAKKNSLKNLVIIESKSLSKDCISMDIINKYGLQPAKSCSKYSLGVIYAGLTDKFNTFLNTMEQIKQIRIDTLKGRFRKTKLNSFSQTKKRPKFTKERIKDVIKKPYKNKHISL